MRKLMQFSHAHPWIVLTLLAGLSVLAAFQVPGLKQDPSAEGLTVQDDPVRAIYEDTVNIFGTDKMTVIFIRDRELFSPPKLKRLEDLVFELEDLPHVARVESLFSVTQVKNEDGALNSGPLMDWVPETDEEARQVMLNALHNPVLVGNLISEKGTATVIKLFIAQDTSNPNFNRDFSDRIERLIRPFHSEFQTIFQYGNAYFRTVISDLMVQDQRRLIPLSIMVLLIALALTTGSLSGAALPLITAGISILLTLGFMSLAGIPLSMLTVIVPSLIIVIGSTEDIHLLSEYHEGIRLKKAKDLALAFMIEKMGTVVMVTALTTFLGFLSICVNKVTILRQFGMAASFGLFVNPLVTCLIAPIYLRLFGASKVRARTEASDEQRHSLIDRLAQAVARVVSTRKKTVLIIFAGLAAVIGAFSIRIHLNNDILAVFKENSPTMRRINDMSRDLAGVQTFSIRISGGHEGIFKEPENLAQVAAIQDFIRKRGIFAKSVSLVDLLRYINREMHGGDAGAWVLPRTAEEVSQYLMFLQDRDVESYVTSDFSEMNIVVNHNLNSSYEQKKAMEELRAFMVKTLNPHFTYAFTGENILMLKAADAIASGQAKSITLMLFIIFLIMSVMFLNMKAGLLSLVPNILPIAIYFGVMGIFSIPLNIGTAMVAAIAIGIAVDDTIHFMTRYNAEMHKLKSQEQAMQVCILSEIRPAYSTSIALALGFGVLAFSNFTSIIHFGILSALVVIVALFCDILVTPILLSSTRLLTLWDILALNLKKEVIEQSEFFRDMKLWQIKKIVLLGRIREMKADEHVYREWDEGDSMFLLLEGKLRIYGVQEKTGREVPYGQIAPGDVFGQIGMLDAWPRSANARAMTDIKFVEINRDDFQRLHSLYPHIASKAFRNLARILGHQLVISNWMYREKVQD